VADKCDSIRSTLHDLEVRREKTEKFLVEPEPGEQHPPKPVLNPVWRRLTSDISSTRLSLRECEESLIPNTPVPLTLTLTKFVCLDQNDEIRIPPFFLNLEDDEPYAIVFAVDLRTNLGIPVGAINSKMTLVGPLGDIDLEEVSAPFNIIWGLSNAPDLVSSADNLILLVAMMENDSSSPDQVRTVLENAARVPLAANLPAFASLQIRRQELVSRIIAGTTGAMGLAKVGIPDPDDNIGSIQELRFSEVELDHIYRNLGPIEKSLTFEGDDAKYVLKFMMFR
jgi:hypothetical protein